MTAWQKKRVDENVTAWQKMRVDESVTAWQKRRVDENVTAWQKRKRMLHPDKKTSERKDVAASSKGPPEYGNISSRSKGFPLKRNNGEIGRENVHTFYQSIICTQHRKTPLSFLKLRAESCSIFRREL